MWRHSDHHIYYDINKLSSKRRRNTVLTAIVVNKRERELKLDIVSYGTDTELVFKEIGCTSGDCWVNPTLEKKEKEMKYNQ